MNARRPDGDPVIAVSDLRMRFGDRQVLDGVDLEIHREEVVALLGPNGAGKSTTIEILEGFRTPSSGTVSVLGHEPATASEAWRAQLGVVLQTSSDHGKWRPRQLLRHVAEFYRPYVDPWSPDELLDLVGLTEHADQRMNSLSGGQRRRLDVALGVLGRPALLFLDEPTTGFDPHARRDFHELVHRLGDLDGTTILLTTHDLAEAEKLASRILILAGGRIIADGSPLELTRAAASTAEVSWAQDGERHVHATGDATSFARRLLATDGGAVTELEITRPTLEDVYLSIVERFDAGEAVDASQLTGAAS